MKKTNQLSPEVRERAARMVQEQHGEYPSLWAAITISPKIGWVPQTLNEWVKRAEVGAGIVNDRVLRSPVLRIRIEPPRHVLPADRDDVTLYRFKSAGMYTVLERVQTKRVS